MTITTQFSYVFLLKILADLVSGSNTASHALQAAFSRRRHGPSKTDKSQLHAGLMLSVRSTYCKHCMCTLPSCPWVESCKQCTMLLRYVISFSKSSLVSAALGVCFQITKLSKQCTMASLSEAMAEPEITAQTAPHAYMAKHQQSGLSACLAKGCLADCSCCTSEGGEAACP